MEHLPVEFWIAFGFQFAAFLIAWGDLRAEVRNLKDDTIEEKKEREKLEERVRGVELARARSQKMGG